MKKFKFHWQARAEYLQAIHYFKSLSSQGVMRFQHEFHRALDLIRRFPAD